ncbi:CrcB family protein [Streptomyces sp. CWNU-1]|uniref:Fluoride-specific ion channel FluC n=1 Tax=Streptomyces albipurpureus TaxID=2897419 RepID=A0ABT0URF2_9ACTN|nr:CrcB family protein [Streptomyces sp. CWNU-1]
MNGPPAPSEPIDPDVDLHRAAQRGEIAGSRLWLVLAVISAGGVVGALARYAAVRTWPPAGEGFPWVTLGINVTGSALIGVLLPLVAEGGRKERPLARLFAGVGVLGGFTTFSAYAFDVRELLLHDRAWTALAYAGGTVAGCVGAVWLTVTVTRRVVTARRHPRRMTGPGPDVR